MVHRNTIVVGVLSAVCALPVWSQDQSPSDECSVESPDIENVPQPRTKVKLVQGPDGKRTPVMFTVREMKIARVIFVGRPALAPPMQEQVAKSLSEHDYDDDQEGIDELLDRTRDEWQALGYFKAEVELSGVQTLEEDSERRTAAVTVKIDAGKQYRLEEIQFSRDASSRPGQPPAVSGQFSKEELRAFFPIESGEIFDIHKLQAGTVELRKAYGKKGFINFAAIPTLSLDETNDRITLVVDLDEGKQYRIGKVEVLGTDEQVAKALIKDSGLIPGNIFDASLLENQKLSKNFKPEDDVRRVLDEQKGIVDLKIYLPHCL